jgi:hypothetical protein
VSRLYFTLYVVPIKWLRPREINSESALFVDGIDESDVIQVFAPISFGLTEILLLI